MTLRFSLGAIIFLAAWVEVFGGKMHLQLGRRGQLNVSNSFNFAKRVFRCGGNVSNKVSSCVNHATKLLHNCHHHADWVDCVCFSPVQSLGGFWLMLFKAMPCRQSGFFEAMLKINMLWCGFKLKYNLLMYEYAHKIISHGNQEKKVILVNKKLVRVSRALIKSFGWW